MKTLKTTIEIFAMESLAIEEMNFLRGGGDGEPQDIFPPPSFIKP
jgi:hypothetical protein